MSQNDIEFRHESLLDADAVVRYLDVLREGFASGSLRFEDATGEIELEPQGLIHLGIDASHDRRQNHLSIQFSWTRGQRVTATKGLSIRAGDAAVEHGE